MFDLVVLSVQMSKMYERYTYRCDKYVVTLIQISIIENAIHLINNATTVFLVRLAIISCKCRSVSFYSKFALDVKIRWCKILIYYYCNQKGYNILKNNLLF